MAKDPTAAAQRWAQNLGSSGAKVTEGVQGVTVAPGAIAARQVNVWMANTQASAQKFARNVGAVGLGAWQEATINKGIPRLASGAAAAQPKMATFLQKLIPYVESAKQGLPARGSYEQNKARLNAFLDKMHQFQK